MFRKCLLFFIVLFQLHLYCGAQPAGKAKLFFTKPEAEALPGKVLNISYFVANVSNDTIHFFSDFEIPENWKIINSQGVQILSPGEKKLSVVTLKVASDNLVGRFKVAANATEFKTNTIFSSDTFYVQVQEIENISLQLLEKQDYVTAGENITATYIIQNHGNTDKKVFLETNNCNIDGNPEVKLRPGESAQVSISKITSAEIDESKNESFTLRVKIADRNVKSLYHSVIVLPSKNVKKDQFFRFPVKISSSFLATNRQNNFETAYQFQLEGRGALDTEGRHILEFMARGPNNSNLSYLGLHDQYYMSYSNKNIQIFAGDKSFTLTPLTENSRYGRGTENRIILNNGLDFGFMYVKPRFYEEIDNEMAIYSGFRFNEKNNIRLYYISKKYISEKEPVYFTSISSELSPFKKTSLELEYSRGIAKLESSDAFRTNLSSQFSVFQISGNYYYAGKNYPGYYKNSTFYSGNVSARITPKLNIGVYMKEDFFNAQLDTFFVTAPYSRSFQPAINYKVASRANLKFLWRDYEKKDRYSAGKFHYETRSFSVQFNQNFKRLNYDLSAEKGVTTNYLLPENDNKQNSFRGTANFYYRINSFHSIRTFGSWSNINEFVSGEQRNLTAGLSVTSRISKNIRANLYLQNAYDIDDYYKNRNLMQLNLDYNFLKKHTLSLRSFYTIFKQVVNDPEFNIALTYSYDFGIPVKRILKSGTVVGRITNENNEGVEGILIQTSNKSSVTDSNGNFEFKSLPPGKHLINIDRSKLEINEMPEIAVPVQMDVFEDETSVLNFRITRGAVVYGQLKVNLNEMDLTGSPSVNSENIIVELKTNTETYRITTDKDGKFTFPLVRPGDAVFTIYSNSIPKGYFAEQLVYNLNLQPGEKKNLAILLEERKRNIIFKNIGSPVLTTVKPPVNAHEEPKTGTSSQNSYYSVQIGAFRKPLSNDSKFLEGEQNYFEKQINNFHKYFIGKYKTMEEARDALKILKTRYRNSFIVVINNEKVLTPKEFQNQ